MGEHGAFMLEISCDSVAEGLTLPRLDNAQSCALGVGKNAAGTALAALPYSISSAANASQS